MGIVVPSKTAPSAQSMPSVRLQFAAPDGAELHVPKFEPAGLVQRPPQHWTSLLHESPFCTQNDDALQTLFVQSAEQQSLPCWQGLPSVLQVPLSAWHAPPTQLPLQHSALFEHVAASAVHAGRLQTPFVQAP